MKKKHAVLTAIIISCFFQNANAQWVSHSVLRNGDWWKIEIAEEGIYRIDAGNIDGLDGRNIGDIAMYGNRGGVLNVTNGSPRPDDLQEIPVEIHDENSNGIFDQGDWMIFYATGPDRWDYNTSMLRFRHTPHPYSSSNYLFLTSSSGQHKRISSLPAADMSTPLSQGHVVALHDNDWTNVIKSGQIWVGERFYGGTTHHSVSLTLPSVPSGSVKLCYALASTSSSTSTFTVSMNGESRSHSLSAYNNYSVFYEEFPSNGNRNLDITVTYQSSENLSEGYIDFIEADAMAQLTMNGNTAVFRFPADSVTNTFSLTAADGTRIWDITDFNSVAEVATQRSGSALLFTADCSTTRTIFAFNGNGYRNPVSVKSIANQDIHGYTVPDMVVVCNERLFAMADSLAELHRLHDNLDVLVVTQEQVFNEFSGGQSDPVAIREMLRQMRSRQADKPSSLLLFGKGTYDNRNLLGNDLTTVITYETPESFKEEGYSMATDDFFTFLHNGESGTNSESRDVAVGRLPAKDSADATKMVRKIARYMTRSDMQQPDIRGDWRNVVALLADDADPSCPADTIFTNSSEITARLINQQYPQYTVDKIYADAYIQQSGADGSFYPDANNALKKRMDYGCLILNYIGHGSSQYIGTERYMTKLNISNYANHHQLPFFITSTCTFGRYDDPDETCGAEEFILADGAGIACLAACRPISHIQSVNTDIIMQSLNPSHTIGEAIRVAKNNRPTTMALTFLGDPALHLSFPEHNVVVTAVNGRPTDSLHADSAMVLSTVTIEGEIHDSQGNLVSDFDGIIYPVVYDRPTKSHTLSNDNEGCEVFFTQQKNLLYKGQTSVNRGRFSYMFTVPRDVAFKYDLAKLSHYAKSPTEDASGAYNNLYLGGYDESVIISECRPNIRLFINDTNFLAGGITDQNPTLLAFLSDSIGINAVGSGLGHDITAILDDNPNNTIILNDFFETDIADSRCGSIRYNLSNLSPGIHTISLRAWNIYNYSNSATISFKVYNSSDEESTFRAWPNPASNYASLQLEHNLKGQIKKAELQIFDLRGACVRTITPSANDNSYVVGPVHWNLLSDGGTKVAPGLYIARFIVTTTDGDKITQHGKIIVK